ncbi:MAG: hypothetical protein V4449_03910 [Patescibacteria group bacterium]
MSETPGKPENLPAGLSTEISKKLNAISRKALFFGWATPVFVASAITAFMAIVGVAVAARHVGEYVMREILKG